jgi:hypothetical protein
MQENISRQIPLDDDAYHQILSACRKLDPAATDQEIAVMTNLKIFQLKKKRDIQNLPGLLITAVPKLFEPPATELNRYRAQQRQNAERTEQAKEAARQALEDPEASEEEKQWARTVLAS